MQLVTGSCSDIGANREQFWLLNNRVACVVIHSGPAKGKKWGYGFFLRSRKTPKAITKLEERV